MNSNSTVKAYEAAAFRYIRGEGPAPWESNKDIDKVKKCVKSNNRNKRRKKNDNR